MRYVRSEEFECKCGCGKNYVSMHLVDRLNIAREKAGIPFIINSGYRCEFWNAEVGGRSDSSHLQGFAADLKVSTSHDRYKMLMALLGAGFNRIGIYSSFIHADLGDLAGFPPEVVWHGD